MKNLTIIGLGKWGETLVKSVQNKSKFVRFSSVISRNPKKIIKISKKYNLKAYNDLGFSRGNPIKDGMSLKDDQLNEMAARSTFRYLNLRINPTGTFTSLIGGNPVQSTVNLLNSTGQLN